MRRLADIERWIEDWSIDAAVARGMPAAHELLAAGEEVLEHWLIATDRMSTHDKVEGFRLLALHRQAAKGDPSFNACRETCRELVYRFNVANTDIDAEAWRRNLITMRRVAQHLLYFISGKMQNAEIGEFCCSARPVRGGESVGTIEGEVRQ